MEDIPLNLKKRFLCSHQFLSRRRPRLKRRTRGAKNLMSAAALIRVNMVRDIEGCEQAFAVRQKADSFLLPNKPLDRHNQSVSF